MFMRCNNQRMRGQKRYERAICHSEKTLIFQEKDQWLGQRGRREQKKNGLDDQKWTTDEESFQRMVGGSV